MCILSMLQSTGGVSIDRFDGGPDRLANSCKHPPSQRRLLYLYSYKIQKDRLAYSRKYSSSFYTSCFNCIFVLVQKIQFCQLFQKNLVSNQQHLVASLLSHQFLSPSGDLGIGLVWDNNRTPPDRHFSVWLLKSSSNWTKLSMRGPQLFSGWYQMIFRLGSD